MPWLSRKKDGVVLLSLHVQPGASGARLVGFHGERVKIAVAAPPVDGKANREVEKFLARLLDCSVRDVEVVSGQSSRQKRVEIRGGSEEEVRKKVEVAVDAAIS